MPTLCTCCRQEPAEVTTDYMEQVCQPCWDAIHIADEALMELGSAAWLRAVGFSCARNSEGAGALASIGRAIQALAEIEY